MFLTCYKIVVYAAIHHKTQFLPDTGRKAAGRLRMTIPCRAGITPDAYQTRQIEEGRERLVFVHAP